MAIPLLQMYKVARYIAGRKLRGDKRYPLVLMLEPLFQCNLACSGCGKIDYPKEILQKRDEYGLTAAELRSGTLSDSCLKLALEIATTVPTSMAGVAAVLRYANEFEDGGMEWPDTDTIGADGWHYQLRQTLAEALGAMI